MSSKKEDLAEIFRNSKLNVYQEFHLCHDKKDGICSHLVYSLINPLAQESSVACGLSIQITKAIQNQRENNLPYLELSKLQDIEKSVTTQEISKFKISPFCPRYKLS